MYYRNHPETVGVHMSTRRHSVVAALGLAALVAAACTSNGGGNSNPTPSANARGGIYRTAVNSMGLTDNLDPTGEYQSGSAWEVYAAMLRTLVTYRHVPGADGTIPVADLATEVPQPTDDGLTWTFHLKDGIKFGPPLNRAITSSDIAYSFQRINTPSLGAQYGFYFIGLIDGMNGDAKSAAKPISGIETPDPQTIVFHLKQPAGDFLYRLALPATAPIPSEVAKCFRGPGTYGRDVIASGPYMLQGSAEIDISSCSAIRPMSGFDPSTHLNLVRNPNYDQSTDDTRANYIDGVQITNDSNLADIYAKIQDGSLDGSYFSSPPAVTLRHYLTDPSAKPYLYSTPINQLEGLAMNLEVPPFDDVHVRKAVNWVLDKTAIQQSLGGSTVFDIATHLLPPTLVQEQLTASYDPYASPDHAGDPAKAEAEMKQSKYDSNQDGKCDSSVCKNVVFVNAVGQFTNMDPVVQESLAKIGIDIVPRELETGAAFTAIETTKNRIPISALGGGYADYADPNGLVGPLFTSSAILAVGCCNYSMVGLTAAKAKELGVPYPEGGIPSVDAKMAECQALIGDPRLQCWIDFDKYMMETVVPYAPYIWGKKVDVTAPTVTKYLLDQAFNTISLTQITVNNDATLASS
jgi:peptide/nickel transport system substrate-binding protein